MVKYKTKKGKIIKIMIKIREYYKPFISLIIIAMILLFIQAIFDLKLPDYMSEIVNVGIQSNGIEQVTPNAISEKSLQLIKYFMSEEEIKLIEDNYIKIDKGNEEYINKYSLLNEENIYFLKEDANSETIEKLNEIFGVSCQTILELAKKSATNNEQISEYEKQENNSVSINAENLHSMVDSLSKIPQDAITESKEIAKNSSKTTIQQVGLVFTKMFYEELGINTLNIQQNYIIKIGIKMLEICAIGVVASILVGYLASRIGAGFGRNLRKDIFEKVQSFSSKEFNKFNVASLITRTTNDVTILQNTTVMGIRMLAYAPITGIGALLMMLQKTNNMIWTIGLGCLGIVIIIAILFIVVLPKIKIVQKLTDKINQVANENLTGIMVIRAFGTQKHEEERFDEVNTKVMKTNKFINRMMGIMMPSMFLIMDLLMVLILWVGAKQISEYTIQVGDLMAVMQYGMQVIMSFLMISMIFVMLPRASVSSGRIREILNTENSIKEPETSKDFKKEKIGYVEFKNVDFSYPLADEKVLENISFIAKPGETTAIIGSTGSGKSTIVNLIPRFFDVTNGEILVNGVNVKDVKIQKLTSQIGYVPQKGNLLSGTIEENLKYGNENATDEFMKKCAEIAQASEFIEEKEEKYKSEISQGAKNVSGGQKQRLTIARALVTDAPIYIFDDSFSALDFKTDTNLRKALKENLGGKTIIIVAQRVSTIMNAEQIIVLDEGKIVGKGTHKELLKNCPTYYEIASSQLSEEELNFER